MKNKTLYYLIPFAVLMLVFNLFLYYQIFGDSIFLFLFLLLLIAGFIYLIYYFLRFDHRHKAKLILHHETMLDKETAIQGLQSKTAETFEKADFILHKRIILFELLIIVILLLFLLFRIWQKE